MARFLSTKVLLITLSILIVVFKVNASEDASSQPEEESEESEEDPDLRQRVSHECSSMYNRGRTLSPWCLRQREQNTVTATPKKQVDPLIKARNKSRRIESDLPPLETSCGEILCTDSPNYPTAEMLKVVEESRRILKSGVPSVVYKNRNMTLESFESQVYDSEDNTRSRHGCAGHRHLTFPLEGYNRRHDKFFYIVNVPGFHQGVCTNVCQSHLKPNSLTGFSEKSTFQAYTEEKLVVLPLGQRRFRIQDLKIRKIIVPHDCFNQPEY